MNRLKDEKSPYLLQHADNPVNWYAWGEEAFRAAREVDKPIFLSIGYSTCHWCHVMDRESFRDEETARLMNDAFVAIKVDREERPDIDGVYMSVCQMLTGSGGWPLTIIMTPDKKPFFAGTYIPRRNRFGQTGLLELIPCVVELWQTRRTDLIRNADQILLGLETRQSLSPQKPKAGFEPDILESAYEDLETRYDPQHGGFSDAPKFPMPHALSFLLRHWKRSGSSRALEMVEHTLCKMRQGGIYDHIGFGFHRYATDSAWGVPHFEKMLYDQALLSLAYTEAFQALHDPGHKNTVQEILSYVRENLTSAEGGFFCAEDADSEGEEGKFYLWTQEEIRRVLPSDTAALMTEAFNISGAGNFAAEPGGKTTGANILYQTRSLDELANDLHLDLADLQRKIAEGRNLLAAVREKRIRPHRDDKILTDWNGLMIAAFARAAQVFDEPSHLTTATKAARFILSRLHNSEDRLLHRFRDGEAAICAFLDDYAFLIWGLLEIYEAGFDAFYLKTALDLNRQMLDHFRDKENGGLFFTADDTTDIPIRKKEIFDGAVPSGNAVAVFNLLRLARITGDAALEEEAAAIVRALSGEIAAVPSACTYFMMALDMALNPSQEVVIVGPKTASATRDLLKALRGRFNPSRIVLLRPTDTEDEIVRLAPFTESMAPLHNQPSAYVCTAHSCRQPVNTVAEMLAQLD